MQHLIGTLNNKINSPVCKMFISSADTRTKSYRIHKHIEFEISLILQGTGIYDTKTGTYDIRPGDIFLYSTNEYHCITDIFERNGIGHMELLNLHFQPSFVWSIGNEYLANSYLKIFFNRNKNFQNRLDRDNPAILRLTEQMISIKEEFENKANKKREYANSTCFSQINHLFRIRTACHPHFRLSFSVFWYRKIRPPSRRKNYRLKLIRPRSFNRGLFLYPHAILFPCGCMLFISTSSIAFPLTASAFSDSSLPVERQSDLKKLF